jgi:hypothetical protein
MPGFGLGIHGFFGKNSACTLLGSAESRVANLQKFQSMSFFAQGLSSTYIVTDWYARTATDNGLS